jgi:general secretion pathway protein D
MMVRVGKPGRYRTVAHSACAIFILLSTSLLVSCNSATVGSNEGSQLDVMDKVRSLDLLPRQSEPIDAATATSGQGKGSSRPAMYEGTDVTAVSDERPQPASSGKGFDLNFENTPVTTVAKVVLGDILGVGYTIDPRVQGTVSLVSIRPVAKSDIVFVLENALRLSGVVLIRDTAGYRLTPLGDAVGAGHVDAAGGSPEPGFGVSVVPLQHVSAQTLLKLMDSFATKAGTVRADVTRNLLLIQGSGAERRTAVDTALSFDVDWMRGQSVGVFPVSSGPPAPIIAELEKIVDSGENGLSQNVVKFQPIARLNAIMVVSKRPEMLRTAATWIKRLDQADTERTSVHVYQVKYGDARQIARVLTDMFIGGSSSSLLDSADNQVAPGSGTSATSSVDRLSMNGNASNGNASSTTNGFGTPGGTGTTPGFGAQAASTNRGGGGGGASALDSGRGSGSGSGQPVLQGDVRITPDAVNNSLLIYADQANYRIIEATLLQVDTPQIQVAIDATIAEVTLTNDLSYGVQTYLTSRNVGLKPNTGSILNTQATTAPATTTDPTTGATTVAGSLTNAFINRAFPGFNFLVGNGTQPTAILDALHAVTSVKVLSNPSLVVINNQVATLQVGDSVPISTGSATVLTGIILRVAPRISANGNVRLDVEQEISNVPTSSSNTPNLTPTVSERKVKSSILVANGQTVLLAGLISEQQNGTRSGIPVLDQIPGLGDAFGHQDNNTTRTELIIFIRPQIIRNGSDAHIVAEELRSKLRGDIATTATNQAKTTSVH